MRLVVTFQETNQTFRAQFSENEQAFRADFGQVHRITEYVGGQLYEGEYEVTPKVESQSLPTKDKVLTEDVTIKAVPIYRVSNTSGGNTVYIAKEM